MLALKCAGGCALDARLHAGHRHRGARGPSHDRGTGDGGADAHVDGVEGDECVTFGRRLALHVVQQEPRDTAALEKHHPEEWTQIQTTGRVPAKDTIAAAHSLFA